MTGGAGPSPRSHGPPFIGLTGGIAAGKSEALAALDRLGAATLSSDAVVHELLSSPGIEAQVVDRLGPEVAPSGRLDRDAVAAAVFERVEDRTWLEELLWPRVGERIAAWRDRQAARQPAPAAIVVEVPLLFEAEMEEVFDTTVAVIASEQLRRERAEARGHVLVDEREARQLGQEEKAARAEHVVENDGGLDDLERELSALVAKLRT